MKTILTLLVSSCLVAFSSKSNYHAQSGVMPPQGREIWLAPQQPSQQLQGAVDFMDMFTPDAPWKTAASRTQVFKLYTGFVLTASQQQLNTVIADLNRRGIAIALETGVMNVPHDPPSGCGGMGNVEGYGTAGRAEGIAKKIKLAHGELKYIAMDEPLFYGHYYIQAPGKGMGCQSPIEQVAQLVKPTLDVFIREFPNVIIGDIEPTSIAGKQADWQNSLSSWASGFRATVGRPLAFFDLDVVWAAPGAMQNTADLYHALEQLRTQHLLGKIGIIYNGAKKDASDEAWVKAAQDHMLALENTYKLHPDQVIFQSWTPNPTHAMPDTGPNTLTSLVNFFFSHS